MVKRVGSLMPQIATTENLHEAFLRAAKGKEAKKAVRLFRENLEKNLLNMRDELLAGEYNFGNCHFFTIFDPKRRVICAASFPERVAFHAMMRICHPVFEAFQTNDSFASRVGKGTYAALERTRECAWKYRWFSKLDVCKYFDSIHHDVLKRQLCRLFKDSQLLDYFAKLIDGYEVEENRGLPIGNLTSQYFANHYLSVADHYAKEHLHVPAMVRYMDDVLLFSNDKNMLMKMVADYTDFVRDTLMLEMHSPVVNKTCHGIPFLGYVVYRDKLRLNQRSRKRFGKKMTILTSCLEEGTLSQEEFAMRAQCLFAFVHKAECTQFLHATSLRKGMYPQGF